MEVGVDWNSIFIDSLRILFFDQGGGCDNGYSISVESRR
jgi:hypothetical protein